MADLGQWGKYIKFKVNVTDDGSLDILQPKDTEKTMEAKWIEQDRYGKRPKSEFVGVENDEISMTVTVSAFFGESPDKTISRLEKALASGKTAYLVIGGKRICGKKVYLKTMKRAHKYTMQDGVLIQADLDLTFKQYT